jgi:hypothetical protein
MIKNFLEIHSKEDVSNAIALFLNRDIKEAEFNGFKYTIKSVQVGVKFCDVEITMDVILCRTGKNIYNATMPYNTYDLIVRQEVQEELQKYIDGES